MLFGVIHISCFVKRLYEGSTVSNMKAIQTFPTHRQKWNYSDFRDVLISVYHSPSIITLNENICTECELFSTTLFLGLDNWFSFKIFLIYMHVSITAKWYCQQLSRCIYTKSILHGVSEIWMDWKAYGSMHQK